MAILVPSAPLNARHVTVAAIVQGFTVGVMSSDKVARYKPRLGRTHCAVSPATERVTSAARTH